MTAPLGETNQARAPQGRLAHFTQLARFGKDGSGRHVAQLGGGTFVVMMLQLATQWAAGSLYTDDDWGRFGNLVSIATITAMAMTLRLEMAIPLTTGQEEADDLCRLSLGLATLLSLILVPVTIVLALTDSVPEEYRLSVFIAPLVVWGSAAFQVLRVYQARKQQFRAMSDANVAGTVATSVLQVGLGTAGFLGTALGLGYGAGRLLSAGMMIAHSGMPVRGRVRWGLVRTWMQFPRWILFPAVANAVTVGAVTPLVSGLYGTGFAGNFNFSQRLLSAPVALLGQAVASVFYVRFAAMERDRQDTSQPMVRLATVLFGLGLAIFAPVVLLSREIFVSVPGWGSRWETAGSICAYLAPWLMFGFVSSPLSGYATVKNQVKRLFLISCIEAGARVPALAAGAFVGDPMLGVQLYSLAGLLICLYWSVWVMRLAGAPLVLAARVVATPLAVILGVWAFAVSGRNLVEPASYVLISVVISLVAAAIGGASVLRALRL